MPHRADLDGNPVRQARTKLKFTIERASKAAHVLSQVWYLTECGCYAEIPPSILLWLIDKDFSQSWLEQEYNRFVHSHRVNFGETYLTNFSLPEPKVSQNTIVQLREQLNLTRTAFAKGLCIQPAVLYKVENAQQRSLPQQVKDALLEAGLPMAEINELQERYEEHYDRRHFRLQ